MPFAVIQTERTEQCWQEDKSINLIEKCFILIQKDFQYPNSAIRFRDSQTNPKQFIVIEYC